MVTLSYREMLRRAYSRLPKKRVARATRFEVPAPMVTVVGGRTILHNFKDICEAMNRQPKHFLKYLSREIGAPAVAEDDRAIFKGRFGEDTFRKLIERYVKEYVICPVCKRPDTVLVKEKRLMFLVCEACGAKSSVSRIR